MKLVVSSPMAVVVEADNVVYVRAEDETGAFGIETGHADFMTVLSVSVITWRASDGIEHHVAVRGGVLRVRNGDTIEVASPQAVGEQRLKELGNAVLEQMKADVETEEESRFSATRLHLATIRQVERYLQAGRRPNPQGAPNMRSLGNEPAADT